MPPAMSAAAMRGSVFTPMYSTIVPPARASAAQSVCVSSFAGSSWPVTKVTDVAVPRCVTGMPAYAGAAMPAVTPGTISNAHARFGERLRLLAAAPEDERVAALEPHDALALAPEPHEQIVDRFLPRRLAAAAALADVVQLDARVGGSRGRDDRGVGQRVGGDRVAASPAARCARTVSRPGIARAPRRRDRRCRSRARGSCCDARAAPLASSCARRSRSRALAELDAQHVARDTRSPR